MHRLITTTEAQAEFARIRREAKSMRERMAVIPANATANLSPAEAAKVAPIIQEAIADIFAQFERDLSAAEEQLTQTESE